MAKKLIVKTEFTAVDGMTSVVKKMTAGVRAFGKTAVASFAKVERGARKLAATSQGLSNKLFNLRNAAGVLAAGFAIKKTLDMSTAVAKVGDEAAKTSRLMGLSAETLQEFRFAADRQGVSAEMLDKSFIALQKRVGELKLGTGSLFAFLNKTGNTALIKQLKGAKSTEEAFSILQKTIAGIKDPTQKAAFASAAFSRSGIEMLKVIDAGSEGLTKLREDARKYGGVVSNEAAMASEEFIDAQTNMNFAIKGLTNTLGIALMPKVKEITERITNWIGENKDLVKVKVAAFADKIGKTIDFVVRNADKLIIGLKILIGLFVGLKAVTIASKVAMVSMQAATIAYNVATKTFSTITKVATAVQWAWNAAMLANPIVLIVVAVIALIAAIAALIIWWEDIIKWVKESDNVFAKLIRLALTPLMLTIKVIGIVISWLVEKFKQLIKWVQTSDSGFAKFIRGSLQFISDLFTTIGNIIDWLVDKWRQMVDWVANSDSGFAKFIRGALEPLIKGFQLLGDLIDGIFGTDDANLTLEQKGINPATLTNEQLGISSSVPEAEANKIRTQQIEKLTTNNAKVDIDINDKSGLADITKNAGANINLTKTLGWQ